MFADIKSIIEAYEGKTTLHAKGFKMASDAYLAGFDAGFAGRDESCNPYSVADVSNFNDWDVGFVDGVYDAETEAESDEDCAYDEWDYDDSMDGDFDSAMRDAGYGTDEDYGYYGGGDEW